MIIPITYYYTKFSNLYQEILPNFSPIRCKFSDVDFVHFVQISNFSTTPYMDLSKIWHNILSLFLLVMIIAILRKVSSANLFFSKFQYFAFMAQNQIIHPLIEIYLIIAYPVIYPVRFV